MAKKSPIDKTVFREDLGLSAILSIEAVDFVKESIFEGRERSYIQEELRQRYKVGESEVTKLIDSGYKFIEVFSLERLDLSSIIDVHIGYYEKIYQWFDSIGEFSGKRKVLQAKERLLGLHQQSNSITINQENILDIKIEDDYSRLTKEEEKRLKELMSKAYVTPRD